jgi:chromosome segregation ATPase
MTALFVALGIAVLTLLALLLWFVPHLLQQQALRTANESAQLRDMLLDLLNEQEAVTVRQAQLSNSIAQLQERLEQAIADQSRSMQAPAEAEARMVEQLEERISLIQGQIQDWIDVRYGNSKARAAQDNESWAYLLSLLNAIQDRVGALSTAKGDAAAGLHAGLLLEELETEMKHLRSISEDIAMLQWRLRRSLHERESGVSNLRPGKSNMAT